MSSNRYSDTLNHEILAQLDLMCHDEILEKEYVSDPSNNAIFDVNQLQKDPSKLFKVMRLKSNLVPKTIVITDFSWPYILNECDVELATTMLQFLWLLMKDLVSENFKIYFYTSELKNPAIEIQNECDFKLACADIYPHHATYIKNQMLAKGISGSQLDIWDYFRTRELFLRLNTQFPVISKKYLITKRKIGFDGYEPNWLNFDDFKQMRLDTFEMVLESFFKKTIEGVIINEDYALRDVFIKKFIQRFPQTKNLFLQLTEKKPDNVKRIMALHSWKIKHFCLNSKSNFSNDVNERDFESLVKFILNLNFHFIETFTPVNLPFKTFLILFERMVNLKTLRYISRSTTNVFPQENKNALKKNTLTKFTADIFSYDAADFCVNIINNLSDNLECLDINLFHSAENNVMLQPDFKNLKELTINAELCAKTLFIPTLIQRSTNLEFLNILNLPKKFPIDWEQKIPTAKLKKCIVVKNETIEKKIPLTPFFALEIINPGMKSNHQYQFKLVGNGDKGIDFNTAIDFMNTNGVSFDQILKIEFTVKFVVGSEIIKFLSQFKMLKYLKLEWTQTYNTDAAKQGVLEEKTTFPALEVLELNCRMSLNLNLVDLFIYMSPMLKSLNVTSKAIGNESFKETEILCDSVQLPLKNARIFIEKSDKRIHELILLITLNSPNLKHMLVQDVNRPIENQKNISNLFPNMARRTNLNLSQCSLLDAPVNPPTKINNNELTHGVMTLDSKTKEDKNLPVNYKVPQYFYQKSNKVPTPAYPTLRMEVYDSLNISEISISLEDKIPNDLKILSIPNIQQHEFNKAIEDIKESKDHFCVNVNYELQSNLWRPLPSVSATDEIKAYVNTDSILIAYSRTQQRYFAKLTENQQPRNIDIQYILKSSPIAHGAEIKNGPIQKTSVLSQIELCLLKENKIEVKCKPEWFSALEQLRKSTLNNRINEIKAFCSSFGSREIDPTLKGISLLNAVIKHKVGRCAHRAIVFKALADQLNIKSRIIGNICHAYIEVFNGNKWDKIDFGGFAASITQDAAPVIKVEPLSSLSLVDLNCMPNKDYDLKKSAKHSEVKIEKKIETFDAAMTDYVANVETRAPNKRNGLIIVDSANESLQLHSEMIEYAKKLNKRYVYIDDLSNVNLKLFKINEVDGSYEVKPSYLVNELKKLKSGDLFSVNWSNFKSEHVGYNTLMDDARVFEDIDIAEGVIVTGLLEKNQRDNSAEDFYSRFNYYYELPASLLSKKPYSHLLPKPLDKKILPINLYGGENWDTDLLGTVIIKGNQFAAIAGKIKEALDQKYDGIELINPEVNSRQFELFLLELNQRRILEFQEKEILVPPNFSITVIYKEYSYEGDYIVEKKNNSNKLAWQYVLNDETYSDFFVRYVSKQNALYDEKGFLELHKNSLLTLHVTSSLTAGQWQKFLDEAKKRCMSFKIYSCKRTFNA